MKIIRFTCFILLMLSPLMGNSQTLEAGPWWPSEWGSDDRAGASNHLTPEKVASAMLLAKTGQMIELGQVYEASMPLFPGRTYSLITQSLGEPAGQNQVVGHDDFFSGQVGQVGTQFDGLGHIGQHLQMADGSQEKLYYNGLPESQVYATTGLAELGVENVKPIITRGILVDVADYKSVEVLPAGYEITIADMIGALAKQGMSENDIGRGDAVLIRTGWSAHWGDPDTYNNGCPGMGVAVARWLVEKQITVTGGDTWGNEVNPNPDPNLLFPVHQELMMKTGTYNIENMMFDELADAGVYEFLFIATPIRFKGATGSPLRPIAIY